MPSPFLLSEPDLYERWRKLKLTKAATDPDAILVRIANPEQISDQEKRELTQICKTNNMAVYRLESEVSDLDQQPLRLAAQFGLRRLDHNWLGEENGLTLIADRSDQIRSNYIPYTRRAIRWHTDGYYNPPTQAIHGMLLHCVSSASEGGENQLLDHEIAYLRLRDEHPGFIKALSRPDAMTIPERQGEDGTLRETCRGPVFSLDASGELHMRFTERQRNIEWLDDPLVEEAVGFLREVLNGHDRFCLSLRLEPGMGLICNNVLHNRTSFVDQEGDSPRLLYRGRYLDRVAGTGYRAQLAISETDGPASEQVHAIQR